ncbi:MAG TPA: succinyl-diaminopimelate desuccinylase [Solirubrobacteraceae bacterium]|jgi:succinyl-diaminopimelate desuccinylase|nr:succinyl-diaminopimelate desuccinylase [Solirubrobacteraceae bacterium]
MLAQRLAQRTLELVDVPSESRDEAAIAAHVLDVLGPVGARDAGDLCVVLRPEAEILLAGHFDTVPAQGNRPGRIEGDAVHGLGAADMKAGLAVMVELALDGAPFGCVFFPREELPHEESALTPLLDREPALRDTRLAIVMEPTANALHAGCVGNVNARLIAHGRSGHSARPWTADNAIHRLADAVRAIAAQPYEKREFEGLTFTEAMSVVTIEGGIALNVVPDRAEAQVNYRYAPGRAPDEAERRLAEVVDGVDVEVFSNAPSGAVPRDNPLVDRLRATGLAWEPKQAWTPVAEFSQAGVDAINFGPGDPRYAHTREEQVAIDALVRSYETLEGLCA